MKTETICQWQHDGACRKPTGDTMIVDYKKKWKTLMDCLELEISLTSKAKREAIKKVQFNEAHDYLTMQSTVQWVLDEMENIEKTGRTM